MRKYFLVGLAWYLGLGTVSGQQMPETELRQRLVTEIGDSHRQLEQWAKQLEYRGILTTLWKEPSGQISRREKESVRICCKGDLILTEVRTLEAQPARDTRHIRLAGMNPHYIFALQREDAAAPWVLQFYFPHSSPSYDGVRQGFMCRLREASPSYNIFGMSLKDLFQNPQCRIVRATAFSQDGRRHVRIAYQRILTDSATGDKRIEDGEIVLCPEMCWAVQSYDFQIQWGNNKKSRGQGQVRYGEKVAGHPIVSEFTFSYVTPGGSLDYHHWQTEQVSPCQLAEADFTLPAYGLPEIDWSKSSPRYFPAAFFLLAFGVLLAALLLRYYVKRRATT
jgi:DNA-binding PadR family transcriptional regulator